ncbi:MAG: glycogen synthase GlgA [Gammaproteobacteria bacterium]
MATTTDRRGDLTPLRGQHVDTVRLLFVASEIYPLAKTGGLADVCAALPNALAGLGMDVRLLMPAYPGARELLAAPRAASDLGEVLPGIRAGLVAGRTPDTGLPIWLVDCPALFDRPGGPYQDDDGRDWPDNVLRFGLLCHAAALIAMDRAGLNWRPDIVHANDWHTGLVPLLLKQGGADRPRTVFTVHNAAFQGNFPIDETTARLQLTPEALGTDGIEFYGQMSFLKAGIRYADRVSTVSPTHARELLTPGLGFGMEGLFQARGNDFLGIMNGIDVGLWNPATDTHLTACYTREQGHGKIVCKATLQHQCGLNVDAQAPLVAYISRLTHQKMADVVLKHLPSLMDRHPRLQFVLHGRGELTLEEGFMQLAHRYPGRMSVRIGYEEAQAHHLHAAADILLHGSRFEPCGLTQLYAMRYGTIPVVSRVGGLADSVVDSGSPGNHIRKATGFVFDEASGDAMETTLDRCLETYEKRPRTWTALRIRAMDEDFSWALSARKYARLYNGLTGASIAVQTALVAAEATEGRSTAVLRTLRATASRGVSAKSRPALEVDATQAA